MTEPGAGPSLPRRAGDAMVWQASQLVGVKLIFLVRLVVLGRLLGPDEFGLFALAIVALDFLLSVTNFGMLPALVQRPDARREHYEAAWTIGLIRALAVGGILVLVAPWVAELFGEPRAAPLLQVLALRPVLDAAASMGVARLHKELRFRSLAFLKLSEAIVNSAVSIVAVFWVGVWALVIGPIAGAFMYAVVSYVVAPLRPRLRLGGVEAGQLARYGRWILVTAWAAVAGRLLLQLGISRELGAAALGVYFMAAKLAFLPAEVSNQVVASVVFPVFARLQGEKERGRRVFRAALIGLSGLIVPASLLIVALAPSLAVDVLGEQWEPAVPVIRILALVNVVSILADVAVPLLQGTGRPDRSTRIELVQYTLLVTLVWVLVEPFGVAGAAAAWLPAAFAAQVLAVVFVRKSIPRPFAGMGAPLAGVLMASALGTGVAIIMD
ncbi:MAG TPA: lipopolysaccharide biosynthesis protein, partial [Gemmatimonadota bacterium]|nr:lipopolysaccharide biosynthesis protein [Gemmatimonadota bacterium]